jgi:hypothetical protein
MGCNCGKGKSSKMKLNNTESPDHVMIAQEVYNRLIVGRSIEDIPDLDWIEITQAYFTLYPNSRTTPNKQDMVDHIRVGIEIFKAKYGR